MINWKTKTIEELQHRMGMTETQATSYYNRIYSQARQAIGGKQKNMKISREIYGSLFYQGEQVFQIDNSGTNVELNPIAKGTKNIEETMRLARMENFFSAYGDSKYLKDLFTQYRSGTISRKEFNAGIKTFKKYNVKYLISGSN